VRPTASRAPTKLRAFATYWGAISRDLPRVQQHPHSVQLRSRKCFVLRYLSWVPSRFPRVGQAV